MKTLCVFCGSSLGTRPAYVRAARSLGETLVERGLDLVYGGGKVGLMGELAGAALAKGGKVTGVMPEFLAAKEIAHPNLTELHLVASMHERKALMAELADGLVMLPGGFGTLEEFVEALTWAQLGLHQKPLGILNVEGYFDPLLGFFDHAVAEGFVGPDLRALVLEAPVPSALLELMNRQPDLFDKWTEPK